MAQENTPPIIQSHEDVREDEIDLTQILGMLLENRLLIVSITGLFFLLAVLYSFLSSPIYKADAVIQIEQQQSALAGMDELDVLLGGENSSSDTEIEIMKSRKVIGGMVEKLNLTTRVEPNYFPIIGGYLARKSKAVEQPADAWMGLSSYAWGGEVIQVDRFEVPEFYWKEPFTLIVTEKGKYRLTDSEDETVLEGEVGKAANNQATSDTYGDIKIFVSRLVARQGTQFTLKKLGHNAVVSEYQKNIQVGEKGKKTGILSVSLEGTDRSRIGSIIDELTQGYLRQNVEQKSEESEKMLQFIATQLPVMKAELNAAEVALNRHREDSGTIDLSFESQNLIEQITRIEAELSDFSFEEAGLIHKLTPDHPVIQGLREKVKNLEQQKRDLDTKLFALPETELEAVKLSRDVTVATELYMLLLNKSQELKVAKAGTIGSARIIDEAVVTDEAVKPKKMLIIAVSLLLGFITGVVVSAMRKAFNRTIDDPNIIEKQLGVAIYAEIPLSKYQQKVSRSAKKRSGNMYFELLAHANKDDLVLESFRSLRTSIQFALMEAENKIIMISGPSPEIGKSFVSTNFAYLMAESGKKILLIDADMRKGHVHASFNIEKSPGLSEMLCGEYKLTDVIHKDVLHENLDVIACGIYPPNPSELLMSDAFKNILSNLEDKYDLIVIDTPPVLAVTDASIVAQYAATSFMILLSGSHYLREIHMAFKRFEQNGVQIKGVIFNGIELNKGCYGEKYGNCYKYYGYQYEYKNK
jgi:tyrosine-protein kinase Etk/Wzc